MSQSLRKGIGAQSCHCLKMDKITIVAWGQLASSSSDKQTWDRFNRTQAVVEDWEQPIWSPVRLVWGLGILSTDLQCWDWLLVVLRPGLP